MNINYEKIENAWFKSKKDEIKVNLDLKGIKNLENYITDLEQSKYVLDELEEWAKEINCMEDYYWCDLVLNKIQELKKEKQ